MEERRERVLTPSAEFLRDRYRFSVSKDLYIARCGSESVRARRRSSRSRGLSDSRARLHAYTRVTIGH